MVYQLLVFRVGENPNIATAPKQGTFNDYNQALDKANQLLHALPEHQAVVIEVDKSGKESGRGWRRTFASSWAMIDLTRHN